MIAGDLIDGYFVLEVNQCQSAIFSDKVILIYMYKSCSQPN